MQRTRMTRGTTSICRQRRPQQGQKAPCAVTGAPVAAYCTVQRTAPEGIPSPRLCCLTPAGSSLRQRDGTYLVPSSRYYYSLATLSLLSAKVNKKHKNLRNLFLGLKTVDRHAVSYTHLLTRRSFCHARICSRLAHSISG